MSAGLFIVVVGGWICSGTQGKHGVQSKVATVKIRELFVEKVSEGAGHRLASRRAEVTISERCRLGEVRVTC